MRSPPYGFIVTCCLAPIHIIVPASTWAQLMEYESKHVDLFEYFIQRQAELFA